MRITTLPARQSLQDETMVYAAIVGAVALGLSFLVASLVAYRGGNDRSYITRRIWYVIIGFVAAAGFYVYNDLVVDGRLNHKGTYVHIANASGDSAAYVKVLQIKVIANYPNRPIHLMVARRSKRITNLSICFNNNNNTDPTL